MEEQIKIHFLGDSPVGKTTIVQLAFEKKNEIETIPTAGFAFTSKKMKIKEKQYSILLWEIHGGNMFLPVLPMYLKDTNIVVFIYDYTNEQTFNDLDLYINKAQSVDPDSKLTKVLISNELHQSPRKVSREEGIKKAKEIGAMFTEVSCITRSGMDDLFENIVEYHLSNNGQTTKTPDKPQDKPNNLGASVKRREEVCFIQ
ncbi:Rab family GTPase [Histomonas meleagridis]|uniref:Rab family GTPase n=1 Tax=Histomonas meleagridis TaxID=135588 RepID=UPI003559ADBA|nr:Rab family GTPase [Histomonas meleagridis]KAH0799699.1 Rab family GTPase [Histomonas meleagridis]